jgi:hypothetical protein
MPLSFDHYDKLLLHSQIVQDRSLAIEIALNDDVRDDALDDIADHSFEILEAAPDRPRRRKGIDEAAAAG